jgi:hypothetical protein
MHNYKAKFGENCVFDEKISLTVKDVLAKYVWFGHVFYMPMKQNRIFIPANNGGWRWVLDDKDIGLTSSGIKLLCGAETKSYLAVHYESQDPAPYPLTLGLSLPEFLGNCLSVVIEDEGCRLKSVVHDAVQPLFVDDVKFTFIGLTNKTVEFTAQYE